MNEDISQKKITKRLDILISLLLDFASDKGSVSIAQKVERLSALGLAPSEIGEILGKKTNYISAVIHDRKKRVKKKGSKNE